MNSIVNLLPSSRLGLSAAVRSAVALGAIAFSSSVFAQAVIVDSVGFELPKFDPAFVDTVPPISTIVGDLEGQAPFPEPLPVGTWQRTKAVNASTAVVQNTVFANGSQAVKVDRIHSPLFGTADQRWAVPVSGWPDVPAFGPTICVDWDMRVAQTVGPTGTFGPFFGVETYDDDANPVSLLASLGMDATTGEVLYQEPVTGFLVAGPTLAFDTWNHFQIILDYSVNEFRLYVNGGRLDLNGAAAGYGNAAFVDNDKVLGGLNEFSDADISTFAAASGASLALNGTAYFDNFIVVQGPCEIPEPSAGILAFFGLGCLYSRIRKSA
jgi:hypothetical protein